EVYRHCASKDLLIPAVSEPPIDQGRSPFRGQPLTPIHLAQAISELGHLLTLRPQTEPSDEGTVGCPTCCPNFGICSPGHEKRRIRVALFLVNGVSAVKK